MGINNVSVTGLGDDVVAGQRPEVRNPVCLESPGIIEEYAEVPGKGDRVPLGPTVLGLDDGPGRSREDRLTPTKAILQSYTDDEVM
jgi:hypothetical protein